ncbi:DUF300-domain-containing protein [Plenodomus tracheiphilus IPT5]|uniref:DUF300-domain-containing protein n=1 Tax=Plenodomus tracheiphilus IPT5 TaxID=1408161 RepID=A0A6A7BAW5_9PLEO|nr:DUF300-domain-containing protein [Plenodomus tracheiphilus IPT5]
MANECESEDHAKQPILEDALARETTFHLLVLSICCGFACIAVALSIWHILRHALHYLRPYEQMHIIRILALIPIYTVTTFLSYVFYNNAIYFGFVRDCYEAYAIASFFTLMCHYVAPNLHEQKAYFRSAQPKNWAPPLNWFQKLTHGEDRGCLRRPRSGLTWFNIVYVGIFQYCLIRPVLTIIAVIAESRGKYCKSSKQPEFASIWVVGINSISTLIAMYCLVQFYVQLKEDLAHHRPFPKVLSMKLVIFLCFWQNILIEFLTRDKGGPWKPTRYIASPDLRIGIPCIFTCVEMAIFAGLHQWAFPWKPYDAKHQHKHPRKRYACGPNQALLRAIYPWDYFKAAARGFRWLFHGVRYRKDDPSYWAKSQLGSKEERSFVPLSRSMSDTYTGLRTEAGISEVKKRSFEGRKTI